jgi:hypothetical protein
LGQQGEWLLEPELLLRRDQAEDRGLQLRRAYIGARGDMWQIRAGRQLFDWSQTDTISPADMLNPRDWSDITRVRKLAVPAVSVRYGHGPSIEAVWMPRHQASTLPSRDWLSSAVATLIEPARQDGGAQHALRFTANWANSDWSAVYFDGFHVAPDLSLHHAPQPSLQVVYEPLRAVALTAARQVGERNVVRAEVARYRQGERSTYVRYVASIDHEWSDAALEGDTVYAIVQYAGSTRPDSVRNMLGWPDFQRVLEHSVMFKLNYDQRSDQRRVFEVSGVFNTKDHDSLWQASVKQRVGSSATVSLSALAMCGKADSFWGGLKGNRRLGVEVGWKY